MQDSTRMSADAKADSAVEGHPQGYATLLPAYFATQGLAPERFGIMLGIFAFAGAFGTLLGGFLGDRFNPK